MGNEFSPDKRRDEDTTERRRRSRRRFFLGGRRRLDNVDTPRPGDLTIYSERGAAPKDDPAKPETP